jgi:hypothetical protein
MLIMGRIVSAAPATINSFVLRGWPVQSLTSATGQNAKYSVRADAFALLATTDIFAGLLRSLCLKTNGEKITASAI